MLFVLASTIVHAGFMMTSNNTGTITLPGSTGSVMMIKINKSEPVAKNTLEKTTQFKTKAKVNKTIPALKKINKKISKTPSTQLTHATHTPPQSESKARVASLIYKELNQYFTYPKLAIKRNWQGKVLLSLRVTSTGKIKNIQINDSSGYDILDQAAINSLSKVEHLPEISSWLPFDIDLKFPVVYKLIEG